MKSVYFLFLKITGLLSLWRFLHRHDITIFMLHGVVDNTKEKKRLWDPLRHHLDKDTLDTVLGVLSKKYKFISLDTAVNIIAEKEKPKPYSIVLTFDDGYKNNITNARPILKKYSVPLCVFVATDCVEKRQPLWFDRIDYVVQQVDMNGRKICIGDEEVDFNGSTRKEMGKSFAKLREIIKNMNADDQYIRRIVNDLAENLETESGKKLKDIFEGDDVSCILTWEDIKAGSKDQEICFGSHTVNHFRLNKITPEKAREELEESKKSIEKATLKECKYLCYPYGRHSKLIENISRECGYQAALTTVPGMVTPGDDLMNLKRMSFPMYTNSTAIDAAACGLLLKTSSIKRAVMSRISGIL